MFMAAIAIVLTVFNACTKDELKTAPDEGLAKTSKADVYLENGYLAFKNMNAVDSTINVLSKMTRQEKDTWEQKIGLKSARYEFSMLFDEYEKLTSKEEFLKFKSKYADQLKFNEMDETDCSIDYPYESTYYASVMNNKGIFKVGMSLFKYTKENQIIVLDGDMKKLENLSAYANDKTVLVSTKLKDGGENLAHNCLDNFGNWQYMEGISDRRLINEIWINEWVYWNHPYGSPTYVTKGYKFYLHQASQKYTWLGRWTNYSTTYVAQNILVKVGSDPTMQCVGGTSPEVDPDYDWDIKSYQTNMTYSGGADLNYLARPLISLQADVSCRGFDGKTYQILRKKHSVFP